VNDTYIFAANSLGIWRNKHGLTPTNVENTDNPSNDFTLEQNYPNPFNASTRIKFTVSGNERISLKVYNILGKLVNDLVDRDMSSGTYEVEFSAESLPSGIYFYSLVTNGLKLTKKLILLK
jgi:hypothetical protein